MHKQKALLEIGVEELPSSEVSAIRNQLREKIEKSLQATRLDYDGLKVFTASRRFGLYIDGLSPKQPDYLEEKKGPSEKIAYKDGEPSRALIGFLKSNGAGIEDITVKDGYVYIERNIPGKSSLEILPGIFRQVVLSLEFKKPMRWGDGKYRFVRPVKWVVSMIDKTVLEMELFGKKASDTTKGHRFYFDEIRVSPEDYFEKLREALVIADGSERERRVLSEIEKTGELLQGKIPIDGELLEEVVSLTEYPTAVVGRFMEKYLSLPPEVIIVTIKHHQRTFPVYREGVLTNNFVAFQDGPGDPLGNIKQGYEDVINARLEDAFFYYEKDLEKPLESYVPGLEEILFQKGLGSFMDKSKRTAALALEIGKLLKAKGGELKNIERTALLGKADQVTRVVQEFPEVQGVMGRIYAEKSGESEEVALGIEEHYHDQKVPTTLSGAVVGVADRIDTVVGNFTIGNVPSASKDPYALRRKMAFIFRTMNYLGWKIDLEGLLKTSAGILGGQAFDTLQSVASFCRSRYESYLLEQGFSINVTRAVSDWWRLPYLGERAAKAITEYIEKAEFTDLLIAYQRVHNISKNHDSDAFEGSKFMEQAERDLFNKYLECLESVNSALEKDDFEKALHLLTGLKSSIDRYFDDVFVMDNQEDIRLNRLGFLKSLDGLFLKVGDLSLLMEEERK